MMKCNNCGNNVDDNARVCPFCGAPAANNNLQYGYNNAQQVNYAGQRPQGTTDGFCITGMVLGIVGLFLSFWGIIPVLAIIFSVLGMKNVNAMRKKGKGMAIAGLVLGIIGAVYAIGVIIACAGFMGSAGRMGYYF